MSGTLAANDRPSGLLANSGIELLTWGTPNGVKASILLEELREVYGKPDYTFQAIDINIQKETWFTELGLNGRIPVIVDHDKGGFAVMEGLAILSYLTRFYDPEKYFTFSDGSLDFSTMEQWMSWQHGGLGPMQGQANMYYRFVKERIPHPTQRYVGETERLYGVLDIRLRGRDYIAGEGRGKYSIADIASFGWVNASLISGINIEKDFPAVHGWWERVHERRAVQRGLSVPSGTPSSSGVKSFRKKLDTDEEARKVEEGLQDALRRAKEQYGYVFKSP